MRQRYRVVNYDYYILAAFIVLVLIGLFMQLDISSVQTEMRSFYKQFIWFILSLFAVWFGFKVINLKKIRKFAFIFVILSFLMLIAVLIFGKEINGAKRSISFMGVSFQPSLLSRIVLVFYFAHILDKNKYYIKYSSPKGFMKYFSSLLVITMITYFLIYFEHHLSIIIISGLTLISLLWLANIKQSTLLTFFCLLIIISSLVLLYGSKYRSKRIRIFKKYSLYHKLLGLETNADKKVDDFQIRQSLISLASGKLLGTGPKYGVGKHKYVPEAETDYIFSIIGEEFGFVGSVIIIFLYTFIFIRGFISSNKNKDLFLKLLGFGLTLNIFFNALVNLGVSMSALPSTGVTLPFISYGGTSLLINAFSVGLILNISAKKR